MTKPAKSKLQALADAIREEAQRIATYSVAEGEYTEEEAGARLAAVLVALERQGEPLRHIRKVALWWIDLVVTPKQVTIEDEATEELRELRRANAVAAPAAERLDGEEWRLCEGIEWYKNRHLPIEVCGVPKRSNDKWPAETIALARKVLRVWGTSMSGKWDTVNDFLRCFGLEANAPSADERAAWSVQRRRDWNHPLAHDWKSARKLPG